LKALACAALAWVGSSRAQPPVACLIEPSKLAEIGSPVVGVLAQVLVERGDEVTAGQPVALLRDEVERAAVEVAEARAKAPADMRAAQATFDFAVARLARAKDLAGQKLIPAQALDEAQADESVARQQLARAREQREIWGHELVLAQQQLAQRTIRSPIDGVVTERYVEAGARVEDRPVLKIATIDPLRVELIVPTAYLGRVSVGQVLTVHPEFGDRAALTAKVTLVDKVIDAASNTFRLRAELPNPQRAVPAGVRCKVDLAAAAAPAQSTNAPPSPGTNSVATAFGASSTR
jgi:RND family efflux transporter MFP subunit